MLMTAVDTYLAVRRAAGFQLNHLEAYLRSFARFMHAENPRHEIPPANPLLWAAPATDPLYL